MSHVLLVDDEPAICWAFENALSDDGHSVMTVASAESALTAVEQRLPDVIVMDIRLPGMDGLSALTAIRERAAHVPVILMTAFGNLETAVEAVTRGAFEYLPKPFDLEQAVTAVRRALATGEPAPRSSEAPPRREPELVGKCPAMQEVFRQIALVARRDVPVLITGESGTGKELVAAAIHRHSARNDRPLVPICVPAMQSNLVEAELFGHVRGAFTGADRDRSGLLADADGGTAFFDEIGDVPPATQVKLLRVLETGQVTPVGANQPARVNFRLIAATNRPLDEMMARGTFREDLFYRLNVFHIHLPPLRERRDDIPLLAEEFLRRIAPEKSPLSEKMRQALQRRSWLGNVRELKNAIERAAIVSGSGPIEPDALSEPLTAQADTSADEALRRATGHWLASRVEAARETSVLLDLYDQLLATIEPTVLRQVLDWAGNNRSDAARMLGMHRQTLRERLRRHGLDDTGPASPRG